MGIKDLIRCRPAQCPRISIVMPAYNASETIAEAIQSVLRQTIRGLKLIVNASADDARAIFGARSSRV